MDSVCEGVMTPEEFPGTDLPPPRQIRGMDAGICLSFLGALGLTTRWLLPADRNPSIEVDTRLARSARPGSKGSY